MGKIDVQAINERTASLRKSMNLGQKEVADYLGITVPAYQKYELRSPVTSENLLPLCRLFNTTPYYLLDGQDDEYIRLYQKLDEIDRQSVIERMRALLQLKEPRHDLADHLQEQNRILSEIERLNKKS